MEKFAPSSETSASRKRPMPTELMTSAATFKAAEHVATPLEDFSATTERA
jgi:hypothetical protein